MNWDLEPGETIRRVDLHQRFGGSGQGGIGPSRQSPNVFIFSDPDSGEQHGYYDRWEGSEFHFAGEGQHGDQTLKSGNGTVLHHKEQGRALRVFWGSTGVVQYAGEFELNEADPFAWADAHESGGTATRKVVMFHLLPKGAVTIDSPVRPERRIVHTTPTASLTTPYRPVDPEHAAAPRDPFTVDPNEIDRGLRGHQQTQQGLADAAAERGLVALSPGSGDPNFDLAWRNGPEVTVVEVKSLTNANEAGQIRLGLGQVLDYQHRIERFYPQVRAVLAVEQQPQDPHWMELCARHRVALVWPATFATILGP